MIAFWLHSKRRFKEPDETWRSLEPGAREPLYLDIWIYRNTIPDYKTEEYWLAYEVWKWWTRGGFPFPGTWADQPAVVIDYIDAIETARQAMIDEDRK